MSERHDLVVGTLSAGPTAIVRRPGVVEPVGTDWSVEWWIGAEDRWHRPLVESTTRQHALPGAPIVETAVRVPGGDVTARTAGVMGPGGTAWTVIEVTNRSAVPVALGWTVHGGAGGLGPGALHRVDGRRVVLGRSPRSIETASDLIPGTEDLDQAVAVQPLPHTSVAWLAIEAPAPPGVADDAAGDDLPTFPPLERVIAGWAPFEEIGARLVLGDDGLQAGYRDGAAVVRMAGGIDLDVTGAALAVRAGAILAAEMVGQRHLRVLADHRRRNGSVRAGGRSHDEVAATLAALRGWCASVWRGVADADELVLPIAAAATWLVKRADRSGSITGAVVVAIGEAIATLDANDQGDAAAALTRSLAKTSPPLRAAGPTRLDDAADSATPTAVATPSGNPTAAAQAVVTDAALRCGALTDLLVRVEPAGIELLAGWLPTWWGRAIEAHDVPTPWGPLSFALRWHGDRPALLWEILGAPAEMVIHAPSVDATWSGTGAAGEELLGAVERPAIASFS